MTSDFRVGKGVQNDPPKSDIIGLKFSDMVGRGGGVIYVGFLRILFFSANIKY